eukprot:scaffold129304_cov43-Prasinocladus_malaysianus.AAC.2
MEYRDREHADDSPAATALASVRRVRDRQANSDKKASQQNTPKDKAHNESSESRPWSSRPALQAREDFRVLYGDSNPIIYSELSTVPVDPAVTHVLKEQSGQMLGAGISSPSWGSGELDSAVKAALQGLDIVQDIDD